MCIRDRLDNPQNIRQFRLNIPTLDEKKWKDMTGSSLTVMYRMFYQLHYLFERAEYLNFPITVIVNGDGSGDHKQEFMKAADNISKSRLIGRVHYPSDSQNGVELGDALYQHYKNQNNESI